MMTKGALEPTVWLVNTTIKVLLVLGEQKEIILETGEQTCLLNQLDFGMVILQGMRIGKSLIAVVIQR